MIDFIINKLKEPSTQRGIAILAGFVGYTISPEDIEKIVGGVVAVIGAIEIIRKEPEAK